MATKCTMRTPRLHQSHAVVERAARVHRDQGRAVRVAVGVARLDDGELVRVLADASESIASLAISPGMSASAAFSLDTGRSGIAVSRDAILRFPDGRVTVWIVDSRDGLPVVREQIVSTGLEFDGFVEIRTGLAEGDRAVTHGNESLQEGQAIKILDGGS